MTIGELPRVLAVDDDLQWLNQIPLILEGVASVECVETIDAALILVAQETYDVILLDLNFHGDSRTGKDAFLAIKARQSSSDVIVISAETQPSKIAEIVNAGVTHFLPKPCSITEIRASFERVMEHRRLRIQGLQATFPEKIGRSRSVLLGKSPAMNRLRKDIELAAKNRIPDVLILGETGTGKEVVAKMIAEQADPTAKFFTVLSSAIVDGLTESELFGHVKGAFTGASGAKAGPFELACGGYVFLDEIGDMPITQQAKLLRVIENRTVKRVGATAETPVHFQLLAATHVDIPQAIEEKRFRADLYYRIKGLEIKIPPLRERAEDIPELVYHFLSVERGGQGKQITDGALKLLAAFPWPGNVRQLKHVIHSILGRLEGDIIKEKDICVALPELAVTASSKILKASLMRSSPGGLLLHERKRFQKAIDQAKGNRSKAAEILNISRATFFRKAEKLGLVEKRENRL